MSPTKAALLLIAVIVLLVASNVFLVFRTYETNKTLSSTQSLVKKLQQNVSQTQKSVDGVRADLFQFYEGGSGSGSGG